jgi:hypothetical protein
MGLDYDIHISAYAIQIATISELARTGFQRDVFSNNTRCDMTVYHGTYRGDVLLPSDSLWVDVTEILRRDKTFTGSVEQESYDPAWTTFIRTNSKTIPWQVVPIPSHQPTPGQYKSCDVHINVTLDQSSAVTVALLEKLSLASFDKPSPEGDRRVFSITCDDFGVGASLQRGVSEYLRTLPDLCAKVKLEQTDRFFRFPHDAPTLPLTDASAATDWLRLSVQRY